MSQGRGWILASTLALALAVATGAAAESVTTEAIDPGHPVNGMLVVQGLEREADVSLFSPFCDPIVTKPGAEARTCSVLPASSRRIFAGYGIWGVSRKILDQAWHKRSWGLWIDGRRVNLGRFGTEEHWIPNFAPANGRSVLLRQWAIILVGAKGTHSIRYRSRLESPGPFSRTTWRFTVPAR
jgi:hypothetical protein